MISLTVIFESGFFFINPLSEAARVRFVFNVVISCFIAHFTSLNLLYICPQNISTVNAPHLSVIYCPFVRILYKRCRLTIVRSAAFGIIINEISYGVGI